MDAVLQIVPVLFVLGLMGGLVWLMARRNGVASGKQGTGALSVEARLRLTDQHTLHVVTAKGREMVVATYPGGCTVLDRDGGREP